MIYVDAYTWVDGIQANYQANGFTVSNTGTACNLTAMIAAATKLGEPNPTAFGTSLFCSPQTYTVAGAGPDVHVRLHGPPDRICTHCSPRTWSSRLLQAGWGNKPGWTSVK